MKTLADLQAFLKHTFPGATVEADPETKEVVIRTNRFLMDWDASNTLVQGEAAYTRKGPGYVIELAYGGDGRQRGTFYYVEEGKPYATALKDAKRFRDREEACQVIDDAGNMMADDHPQVLYHPGHL